LRNRILAFTALPLETLDRISLQKAVDDIARDTGADDGADDGANDKDEVSA